MNVEIIKADNLDSMYEAARVCRNSGNAISALEHSIKAGHESILEQASVTYKIEGISRACANQLVRHRIASYAQQSQRHTKIENNDWYVRPESISDELFAIMMDYSITFYNQLLYLGVTEEDARYVLPNACKTEIVMTINLRSLINFFNLRICSRAQWEIQDLAVEMYKKIKHIYPIVFKYYKFPKCNKCKEPCKNPIKGV